MCCLAVNNCCVQCECGFRELVAVYLANRAKYVNSLSGQRVKPGGTCSKPLDLRVPLLIPRGPGSVVGIATGYGLDGPGIESRWG